MATASKTNAGLSFAFCYGLASGPAHARQLKKLLQKSGHRQRPLTAADIIIAHSAGCWLIPADVTPKLVVYVGLPLAQAKPARTWRRATAHSFRLSVRHSLRVRLKSSYYGLRQPRRNLDIIRMAGTARPRILPDVPTVCIANRHDPWPHADQLDNYLAARPWAFIHLPGSHDDIWEHSGRYAAIITHYATLLAEADRH